MLTIRKKWLAGLTLLLALALGPTFAMETRQEEGGSVDELLVELKSTLEERTQYLVSLNKEGLLGHTEMLIAENELLTAALGVYTDHQTRVATLKKRLENCIMLEEKMTAEFKVASGTAGDLLKAKAERLIAQIELERELYSNESFR